MRRILLLTCLAALLAPALPAADGMDYELSRAYAALSRGQENRARHLFKEYLAQHPDAKYARQGYEEAGGDLAEIGLAPTPKPTPRRQEHEEGVEAVAGGQADEAAEDGAMQDAAEDGALQRRDDDSEDDEVVVLAPAAPSAKPAWLKRQLARLKGAGLWALMGMAVMAAVGLLVLFAVLGVRFSAWHEAKRADALQALAASSAENVYVEYRHWSPWWGAGLDSEEANNRLLQQFNQAGWTCLEARREWGGLLKLSFAYVLFVVLVQLLTFGFMRYYTGPTFLFRRQA